MKKYLLSGGAGFIGSNLTVKLLADKDNKVICLDSLLTGFEKNIKEFLRNPNYKFINHNIIDRLPRLDYKNKSMARNDSDGSNSAIFNDKFDYVLNLACPASPVGYRKNPVETLEVSSIGTKNMLEIARRDGARFFHTSTSEVYGDPLEHPQRESYWGNVNSYGERSCYDEAKRYAEALIYYYNRDFGVNTGIIRIFNTYGPKMDPFDGRVVSNFIRQALKNEDITIYGDGKQARSFCFISDQVEAEMRMIHSNEEGPINIGNPVEFTMLELAEKVIELTGSKSKLVFKPMPKDDPKQRKPDITKAKEKLNWEPKVQLEEGLGKTIEWFQTQKY